MKEAAPPQTAGLDLDRIQALCFDVDGTLSDTDDQWMHASASFLNRIFPKAPPSRLQSISRAIIMALESPGNQVYHLLDHIDLDDEAARLIDWYTRLRISNRKPIYWLIPGVDALLETLSRQFPLAVVSARDERTTLEFLNQHHLRGYFKCIATAQTCRHTKPFPDPIRWAAAQMGVDPRECLMIGDTVVDILSARAAGAQRVGVLCGFGTEKELRRFGADLILPSTADLGAVLSGSRSKYL